MVDIAARQVVGEIEIGEHLSDLVSSPLGGLLTTDEARHELVLIEGDAAALKNRQRLAVPAFPVSIALAPGGRRSDARRVGEEWTYRWPPDR